MASRGVRVGPFLMSILGGFFFLPTALVAITFLLTMSSLFHKHQSWLSLTTAFIHCDIYANVVKQEVINGEDMYYCSIDKELA